VLDDLEFDDSDSPAIGLVPPGVSWEQVHDHIKIAHHSLLVPPSADGGQFAGAYWTGTDMVVIDDLDPDQDRAAAGFALLGLIATRVAPPAPPHPHAEPRPEPHHLFRHHAGGIP
jgi:hypothetical protein